ncbi:MAG: SRPBCC domain-containing protein [Deltaproteobacteria bacterium]|nr:SRPBCC domain-containing protein [Deltaproteobacteria bacterium]
MDGPVLWVGRRFRFTDKPRPFWDGICDCEVAQANENRCFSLLRGLNQKGEPSRVSWTLQPAEDGGTQVEFRHGGLHGVMGWLMKKGMSKGWQRMLERSIPMVAEGIGKGRIPPREDVIKTYRGG